MNFFCLKEEARVRLGMQKEERRVFCVGKRRVISVGRDGYVAVKLGFRLLCFHYFFCFGLLLLALLWRRSLGWGPWRAMVAVKQVLTRPR